MGTQAIREQVRAVIAGVPRPAGRGKIGRQLHRDIAAAFEQRTNFRIDCEDTAQFLQARMPVWRDKAGHEIEGTAIQRKIDIVIYEAASPIALIEIESDLNDLRMEGVSKRSGHYDVFSIAKSETGEYFHSYKSLERMAAAAMYHHLRGLGRNCPSEGAVEILGTLKSDKAADHNPANLPMFLVSGFCRPTDSKILAPRLKSLNAELICKGEKRHLGGPHSRAMTI